MAGRSGCPSPNRSTTLKLTLTLTIAPIEFETFASPTRNLVGGELAMVDTNLEGLLSTTSMDLLMPLSHWDIPHDEDDRFLALQRQNEFGGSSRGEGCTLHGFDPRSMEEFEAELREELRKKRIQLVAGAGLSLRAIQDPPGGNKPGVPLHILAKMAIDGSPRKRLSLKEICDALIEGFAWFRGNVRWKASLRHALSRHQCFRNVGRDLHAVGRGGKWELTALIRLTGD
ncbi:hypothetical protein B0H14DRAFT_2837970 [Mycena olivaceomarginata]|nr:hypothetical protein B0H14DRAFT_2837970 [Mycena olivaceomarginata]